MGLSEDLKAKYFEGIYKTKAFLFKKEPFTLQSGKKSHLYLNHRDFLSQSNYLTLIAEMYHLLADQTSEPYQLGAVDSVTSPIIVGAMSTKFNLDYVVIKREPLKHGTQDYIYGVMQKPIVLIDDMTSTGETLIDAAAKIRAKGGTVNFAIISAYRDNTAIENLAVHNIKTLAIAGFEEILEHLKPSLTENEKQILESENKFKSSEEHYSHFIPVFNPILK